MRPRGAVGARSAVPSPGAQEATTSTSWVALLPRTRHLPQGATSQETLPFQGTSSMKSPRHGSAGWFHATTAADRQAQ
jgi:hypothetical protein